MSTASSVTTTPPFGLRNLGDILRLPAHGDLPAIIDLHEPAATRRWSAFEFDALCQAVGRGLERRGFGRRGAGHPSRTRGARIAILAENRVEFIACYFGIMRIGAVAVPVNHKLPRATIEHIFRDSAIELAFTDAARRSLVPEGIPTVEFAASTGAATTGAAATGSDATGFDAFLDPGPMPTAIVPEADAEILYTSGSTGLPKGVPLNHHGQLWAIGHYLQALPAEPPRDTTIVVAPLYHMNGLFNITVALASRVAVVLLPQFEARRYLEAAAAYHCTLLSGIPTMFALMVREPDLIECLDLRAVRDVTIGSAPLTDALLAQVHRLFPEAQVRNGYGTTEAGPAVFGPHPDGLPRPPLSLGYPFADVECALVDGPTAAHGELALRTPALTHGYLNLPAATASRMRDGWYLTGDVMRRDAQGFYFFVGRADDMFVCGGENIYPGEVEKLLERHADVAQAIVVAAPDDIKGAIPIAFIVPRPGSAPTVDSIKEYALHAGPAYAHPRFVEFMPSLPVSGTHKIDRTALTAAALRIVRAAGRSS
jgi:acyl-CoA synthetase (AMP-forming)/AMP-acid ligase II